MSIYYGLFVAGCEGTVRLTKTRPPPRPTRCNLVTSLTSGSLVRGIPDLRNVYSGPSCTLIPIHPERRFRPS